MNRTVKQMLSAVAVCMLFSCNQNEKKDAPVTQQDTTATTSTAPIQYTSCKMVIQPTVASPQVNEKVSFQLKPVAQPGNVVGKLETVHEKKIHLIIANDDLSYFQHLHLDKDSNGVFNVETSFPVGGTYTLYADYKAEGIPASVDTFHISVQGKQNAEVKYSAPQLAASVDGYDLQLLTKKIYPLSQSQLILKIKKDGNNVLQDQLQSYLGEKSHFIAINTTTKEFVHAHSMSDQMSYWYMLTLPRAGFYKTWLQFKTNDIVHTAAFVVEAVNTK